jgi:hypothetical protein
LGLFDFHDHSIQKSSSSDNETNERVISLCLNRFKKCRIDPSSHTYILDIEQEDSKTIETDHIFFICIIQFVLNLTQRIILMSNNIYQIYTMKQ